MFIPFPFPQCLLCKYTGQASMAAKIIDKPILKYQQFKNSRHILGQRTIISTKSNILCVFVT